MGWLAIWCLRCTLASVRNFTSVDERERERGEHTKEERRKKNLTETDSFHEPTKTISRLRPIDGLVNAFRLVL